MSKKVKKAISKGALFGAAGIGTIAAYIGLSDSYTNDPTSELWMYTSMGTFLLFVFLHWFFQDESFNKLKAIKKLIITILLPHLALLTLYAFSLGSFVAMFVCLGFFVVTYLIHLLIDNLKLEKENAG